MAETTAKNALLWGMTAQPRDMLSSQVEIAPGLLFDEAGVSITASSHPSGLHVEVDVVPSGSRLVVSAVRASRRPGGEPVTLAALRDIALTPFLNHAAAFAVAKVGLRRSPVPPPSPGESPPRHVFYGLDEPTRDRLKAQGPTEETLRWVGAVYSIAYAVGMKPAKTVRDVFDVSARTATNWVAAARAAGHLNGEERPE